MPHQLARLNAIVSVLLLATGAAAEDAPKEDAPKENAPKEEPASATSSAEWGVDGPYVLDLHARIGGGLRLDEPPAFEIDAPGGGLIGVGLGLALSPRIGMGLTYEYLDLGTERSSVQTSGAVRIERELHNVWLDVKIYPIKWQALGVYLSLAAGLSMQGADLAASVWLPETPGNSVEFFCSGSGDPGFAFQGALGFDVVVAPGVRVLLDGAFGSHRLSDDIVGNCAPGAGTATVLTVRSGIGYAWDL